MEQQTLTMANRFEGLGKKTRHALSREEVVPGTLVGTVHADRADTCQGRKRAAAGGSGANATDLLVATLIQPCPPWSLRSVIRFRPKCCSFWHRSGAGARAGRKHTYVAQRRRLDVAGRW
jgi:hypothetical protein